MRVLVVDDNEDYLEGLGSVVKDCGHRVLLATDGKQAREFLEFETVDAIISDIYMPTLDGIRFHSYVRDFLGLRELPFIYVSGFADEETQKSVLESRRDFFLHKTAPMEDILEILHQFDTQKV